MKEKNNFNIDIYGLKNGSHEYQFKVGEAFFGAFEYSLIEDGRFEVNILAIKTDTFIKMEIQMEGKVTLLCDRTLKPFDHPLNLQKDIIYKFGEEDKELDEDIIIIKKETQRINVAQLIYELASVSIPMKRIHPDHIDSQDEGDEGFIVFQSDDSEEETDEEQNTDPRWEKLKKLKGN